MLKFRLVWAVLLWPGLAWSQTPTLPGPEAKLSPLIEDLASPRYVVREKAHHELLKLPADQLKWLKAKANSEDAEQATRLRAIIGQIEREDLNRQLLVSPSLSFEWKDMLVTNAISDLSRKTGIKFQYDAEKPEQKSRRVSVKIENKPFFEAIEIALAAAKLDVSSRKEPKMARKVIELRRRGDEIQTRSNEITLEDVDQVEFQSFKANSIYVRLLPPGHQPVRLRLKDNQCVIWLQVLGLPKHEVRDQPIVSIDRVTLPSGESIACRALSEHEVVELMANERRVKENQRLRGRLIDENEALSDERLRNYVAILVDLPQGKGKSIPELRGTVSLKVKQTSMELVEYSDLFQYKDRQRVLGKDNWGIEVKSIEKSGTGSVMTAVMVVPDEISELEDLEIGGRRIGGGLKGALNPGLLDPKLPVIKLTKPNGEAVTLRRSKMEEIDDDDFNRLITFKLHFEKLEDTKNIKLQLIGNSRTEAHLNYRFKDIPLVQVID